MDALFVGRFDRQKGFDIVLKVAESLKGTAVRVHIVGDYVLENEQEKKHLDNVVFHGWIDRRQIGAYYQAADLLLMPSRWEGFGLVAAEAMAHGCPVLASDRGALPEVVLDGIGGWISGLDDYVEQASRLLRGSKEVLAGRRRQAMEHARKHHNSVNMNESISRLYERLISDFDRQKR